MMGAGGIPVKRDSAAIVADDFNCLSYPPDIPLWYKLVTNSNCPFCFAEFAICTLLSPVYDGTHGSRVNHQF